MQDHATRLVGLDGLVVTEVQRTGERLDRQVDSLARAAGCPHCGGSELRVKERPRVGCAICRSPGGSRGWCGASAATAAATARAFTESHDELPPRQRVTVRFRARLVERVVDGAARAEVARQEHTTRYQVARAFADRADQLNARDGGCRRAGCRCTRRIIAAATSWSPRPARPRRLRQGHPPLAPGAAGLLRRSDHQRLRRGRHQQGQGHQAPRLRHPHLHRLPPARAPSMPLTATMRRHPARSTRTES
jgi:hypothetical protein